MFYLFLDLLILTVASEKTDGFKRFIDSANLNGLKTKVNILTYILYFYGFDKYLYLLQLYIFTQVLGLDKPWQGGNMKSVGGGYKLNLYLEALEPYKNNDNLAVLLTDS